MKFITNQVFDQMGVQHTSFIGPIFDAIMRNTREAGAFIETARTKGVSATVAERDGPFGDYSQGGPELKPRS